MCIRDSWEAHEFVAKGKKTKQSGYKEVEAVFRKSYVPSKNTTKADKGEPEQDGDNGADFEDVREGMELPAVADVYKRQFKHLRRGSKAAAGRFTIPE